MLLETTDEQVHVQKKLKYFALLALRVLLLLLLALAFAKPLWTDSNTLPGPAPEGTHVVLLDASASMNAAGVFEQALSDAREVVASAPGGALLQVLSASSEVSDASGIVADRAAANTALQGLGPDLARLDFGAAMATVDRLARDLPPPVTLHVISDFQGSGLPARFADLVSSQVSTMQYHQSRFPDGHNWSIDVIRPTAEGIEVAITKTGGDTAEATVVASVNGIAQGLQNTG